MQMAFMIPTIYLAEFCYLNIGVGVVFMKLVVPLAMLLFVIHITWALLASSKQKSHKSLSIFSQKIGIHTLLKWNFALIYANISALILKDYIQSINGIPVHLIYVSGIMCLHMMVAIMIIKLAFDDPPQKRIQ